MAIRKFSASTAKYLGSACILLLAGVPAPSLSQTAQKSSPADKSTDAASQTTGMDIVVTANKRGNEALQKVPVSISAVTSRELERTSAQSIQDYARALPGLAVFDTGANQKKIKIRGVSGSSDAEPQETVGVYLDDVSITSPGGTNNENNASPDLNLFDIQRIEVLKGPQGTLYGAGSMGGTIRFITNPPKLNSVEAEVQTRESATQSAAPSYGGDAMVNLPIVDDKLAIRLVGTYRHDGGFIDNVSAGFTQKNYNDDTSWLVRGTILYRPTAGVDLALKYLHRDVKVNGLSSVPAGSRLTSDYLIKPDNNSKLDIINGVINIDAGGPTITSSTSYLDRRDLGRRDLTPLGQAYIAAISDIATPAPPIGLYNQQKYHEFAEELRLASDNTHRLKYVFGTYFSKLRKRFIQDGPWIGLADFLDANGTPAALDGKAPFLSPVLGITDLNFYSANVDQSLQQIAVFGEATYSLSPKLDLTLGGRYFNIKQNFVFDANPLAIFVTADADYRKAQLNESGFNPKGTISFKAADNTLLYGTVAKGFRPGGFNQPVSSNPQCQADFVQIGFNPNNVPGFKSDSLWSYELGLKTNAAENRIQFNGAVYQIDWTNIQLRNPLSCGFTIFDNAAKARIRGLEASLSARVLTGLTLGINTSYIDARILSADVTTGAVPGDSLLGVPKFTIAGSADYEIPVSARTAAYARIDANYVGSYNSYFSQQMFGGSLENVKIGNFTRVDARVGLNDADRNWDAQLFVNNLFNEIARTGAQNDIFGEVVFKTRPREFGIQVNKKF